ncbi:Stk1 family PASTA domain-containing Ser/Thr kinase [Leekyejoonella antrihumi]|uniref:non-specific serine/threonine protein kinase n=1 Tax=Leekyejoonella antrihumi TaxID=1660198 RepID=A0A563E4C9_9MICO|nr:Stk1 family PASTA domain-containing Ser/Thr kinase [Leekyejoonella antrihumi]
MPMSLVGRTVDGRYTVQSHVADGGMGSVYIAMDRRLDRDVALKIMRPDLARDEAFVARFRREAKSAARLAHPHVVSVTDQGADGDYVFLAMELVRGGTLRTVIREEAPLPPGQALDIADAILQALSAAHRAGLVHRDVKPENVLIGEDGAVKVADFGLARAVTTETLTADSDVLLGTAAYLSPEQVEHGTADERTDVYAAALLLFEMLTGRKAFPGDSPIHVAYQHVHGQMPVASDLVPTVPVDLDDLLALGTAKDPDDRPADATAYLAALRATRRGLSESDLEHLPEPADSPVVGHPAGAPDSSPDGHTRAISTNSTDPLRPIDERPDKRPRFRRRSWLAALLVVLLVAGVWVFTLGPLGQTTVPSLRGRTQGVAVAAVQRADLQARVTQDFSESVAKGTVISATPASGDRVRKHGSVTLHVSKGPERYDVPTLTGQTLTAATSALRAGHLTLGTVTNDYSPSVPSGQIISVSPVAGTPSKKGTAIDLVVSKGLQPVDIPDVTGQPKPAATSALTDLGLKVTFGDDAYSSTVGKGDVITQTPTTGPGHKGDTVNLVVSKGPQMVTVPDVRNDTTAQATTALQKAGLKVQVNRYFGGIFDNVRGQTPSAHQSVPIGTTVTISVV